MKKVSIIFFLGLGLITGMTPGGGNGFLGTVLAGSGEGSPVSFHGYGELHYSDPDSGSKVPSPEDSAEMDFHRMVWGMSYSFNDRTSLHTEVDFEHAATEMELEFAYLDFRVSPAFNIRAGAMLMPVGPLNEFHEPPLFYSVERPYVQSVIIPTTWQEGGAGLFGNLFSGLKYRLYLVTGLDASGFSSSKGIRGGRSKVAGALSDDLAVVGRLEYVGLPGLKVGVSAYQGDADQKAAGLEGVSVGILEADLEYRIRGFEFRGVYAQVDIRNPEKITTESCDDVAPAEGEPITEEICTSSFAGIGEQSVGWTLEGAYDLLRPLNLPSDQRLMAFVRWERINTQKEVPDAYTADPTNDRRVLSYGVSYFPYPDVAIKAGQERWNDEAGNEEERFNVGLAYMF